VRRAVVALSLAASFALTGCGTGGLAEQASTGNGQQLFREKCGGCHTLADAGTRGTIGPNLDHAFQVPLEEGFDESTVREVVLGQMRFPVPPMPEPDSREMFPPGEYTDDEREDALETIAAYVAAVAARPTAAAPGGGAGGGDASDPKGLFSANCASCHTFAAAEAKGTVGPSLDASTLDAAAIEQQIRRGGGGMPPFEGTLTDAQITALTKWIVDNRGG
jgi:mono/diheme cytochrome c family protein